MFRNFYDRFIVLYHGLWVYKVHKVCKVGVPCGYLIYGTFGGTHRGRKRSARRGNDFMSYFIISTVSPLKTLTPSSRAMYLMAACAFTEFPASSNGGAKAAIPNTPGRQPITPPTDSGFGRDTAGVDPVAGVFVETDSSDQGNDMGHQGFIEYLFTGYRFLPLLAIVQPAIANCLVVTPIEQCRV